MNNFNGIGRLVKDPELKVNSQNKSYCRFTIAIDNSYTNDSGEKIENADFINCVCWNNTAENLCKYQKKGNKIAISGKLHTYSYKKDSGDNEYTYDIIVNQLEYLDYKSKDDRPEPEYYGVSDKEKEVDPFAEYGEQVVIDDGFLD